MPGGINSLQGSECVFFPRQGSCIEWANRHNWPNDNSIALWGLTVIGKASLNLSCLLAVTHSRPYAVITEGQLALYKLDRAEKTAVLLPEPERTWGEGSQSPVTDINSSFITESSSD